MTIAAHAPSREALPVLVRLLLDVLTRPGLGATLDLAAWDRLLRLARSAQLAGTLAARIESSGALASCPEPVRHHLRGASFEARYVQQMARVELDALAAALAPHAIPLVLLKGAAYLVADAPVSAGRMLRDVDVLVPVARLSETERVLVDAGWHADAALTAYDQHYYRAWSHQLPPLRRRERPLEVDVHHTILPPTGRIRPDVQLLMRDTRAVTGGWHVLDRADQVVHAAVHLFQDSDLSVRLRDVVDVDALCTEAAAAEHDFWPRLVERARRHGAQKPVGYAIAFARAWLLTPVDASFDAACAGDARWHSSRWVVRSAELALPPPDPDTGRTLAARRAARALFLRAQWLRMPPWLLARHAAAKAWRALRRVTLREGLTLS